MGYDVFISYSSHDREWVEVFVENLKKCGVSVWCDRERIDFGTPWPMELGKGLEESSKLVVVVSPASMASPWVLKEISTFQSLEHFNPAAPRIYPVILRAAPRPPSLKDVQYITLGEVDDKTYNERLLRLASNLMNRTVRGLNKSFNPPPTPLYRIPDNLWKQGTTLFSSLCGLKPSRKGLASDLTNFNPEAGKLDLDVYHPPADLTANAFLFFAGGLDPEKLHDIASEYRSDLENHNKDLCDRFFEGLEKLLRGIEPDQDRVALLRPYLDAMEAECNRDLLGPLFPEADFKLVDEVYVELKAIEQDPKLREDVACCMEEADRKARKGDREKTLRDFLKSDLSRCWTLQGDPGSGKTTLLLYLALTLCREFAKPLENQEEALDLIPLLISINDWHKSHKEIWEYLKNYYSVIDMKDPHALIAGELAAGRVLWLLDGFDEVDPSDAPHVARDIQLLSQKVAPCPVVMTSRRFGYIRPGREFKELELLPISLDAQNSLLKHFTPESWQGPQESWTEKVLGKVAHHRALRDMASNPFFLTLIGLVASQAREEDLDKLPTRRSELLEEVEYFLLQGKPGSSRTPMPNLHASWEVLECLALKLLTLSSGPYSEDQIEKQFLTSDDFGRLLEKWPGGAIDTRKFLEELANRTGLMISLGRRRNLWRFLHRSLQEHLSARCLARQGRRQWETLAESLADKELKVGGDAAHLGQWAETFAYLAGEVDNPNQLLKRLMEINPGLGLRALATADNVEQETLHELLKLAPGDAEWAKRQEIIESIPERLGNTEAAVQLLERIKEGTRHGADLYFLSQAFQEIAQGAEDSGVARLAKDKDRDLFDHIPDPPVGFLERIMVAGEGMNFWCEIPGGEFKIGSPPNEEGRWNDEPEELFLIISAFKMATVPLTNGLYELFDPSHQADRAFMEEISDEEQPNHPVVNITWYEAVMFCRWATEVLQKRGVIGNDKEICLPSEAQWEYACRAGTRTRFWSGDKEADLAEAGWYGDNSGGKTHAVGTKPSNPWGFYDVHGNVWEWCKDAWSDPYDGKGEDPIVEGDKASSRVYRGGSWSDDARNCRSAYRFRWDPGGRSDYLGFRPASSSR